VYSLTVKRLIPFFASVASAIIVDYVFHFELLISAMEVHDCLASDSMPQHHSAQASVKGQQELSALPKS